MINIYIVLKMGVIINVIKDTGNSCGGDVAARWCTGGAKHLCLATDCNHFIRDNLRYQKRWDVSEILVIAAGIT